MPSLDKYRSIHSAAKTNGILRKLNSDAILEQTWYEDIASRTAYFYDMYHDSEPLKLMGLNSPNDEKKIPIEIKFIQHSHQTYDKDQITFHIMFKPSYKCSIDYYSEVFEKRYDAIHPVGLYCDIPDEKGIYNRWLVVNIANYYGTQFPTFEVLPCNKIIQYILQGIKYQVPAVLRSQNSYNSGIWTDHKFTLPEDQQLFAVPLNRDTEKIYYDQRLIIDNKVLTEPRTWHVTKVNRVSPNGIVRIGLAQDKFDQNKDYIEIDETTGNIIGMWANYYDGVVAPSNPIGPIPSIHSVITYSGLSPELKSGGGYKKFTVSFFDGEDPIDIHSGTWSFKIDNNDASDLIQTLSGDDYVKVKFIGGDSYINSVLTITYLSDDEISSSIEVGIVSL